MALIPPGMTRGVGTAGSLCLPSFSSVWGGQEHSAEGAPGGTCVSPSHCADQAHGGHGEMASDGGGMSQYVTPHLCLVSFVQEEGNLLALLQASPGAFGAVKCGDMTKHIL